MPEGRRNTLFASKNILDLFNTATSVEYSDAEQDKKDLWEIYTMEILPCTYGRGAENFWRKYRLRHLAKQKNGLEDMFNKTDEALALATIEVKRDGVINPPKFRLRGAPRRENQCPVTPKLFKSYHIELQKRGKIKKSWLQEFDKCAKKRVKMSLARQSQNNGEQQENGEGANSARAYIDTDAFAQIRAECSVWTAVRTSGYKEGGQANGWCCA